MRLLLRRRRAVATGILVDNVPVEIIGDAIVVKIEHARFAEIGFDALGIQLVDAFVEIAVARTLDLCRK